MLLEEFSSETARQKIDRKGNNMDPFTLADLWAAITTVVSSLMGTLTTVGSAILSNILFQTVFGIGIAYTAVRLFKRLTHI